MKGIVLAAGGTGSRFFPLTKVTNKHLGCAPLPWHTSWKLKQFGIEEILIVSSTENIGDLVGDVLHL